MHWRKLARLKRYQRDVTQCCMVGLTFPPPPITITITRSGPRKLDDDNLEAACKHVRDQIAARVGVDDGSDQYTWVYRQRVGPYGVDVEVEPRMSAAIS